MIKDLVDNMVKSGETVKNKYYESCDKVQKSATEP